MANNAASQAAPLPPEIYATLSGTVDGHMVQRVLVAGRIAVNRGVTRLHLLIHSTGGGIGDGIAIYNFLRWLPIEIITYNVGSVSSIAVVAYLAGSVRRVSRSGLFMIHKSTFALATAATAERLQLSAQGLQVEDARVEAILHEHIQLSETKWAVHERGDLYLTAQESVDFGLAHEIADFAPPAGAFLDNI